ncbi:MAG TPA: hypothetical protein VNH46_10020 [Gemmatimonadales bacterium]|nr:hypothetical protein [Gemmatimonadales bacterium]
MPFRQTTVAGLPAVALFTDEAELITLPGAAGRITHLRRRAGREWLWRNRALPFRAPPRDPGSSPTRYVDEFDSGGWDECFPTVGACPLPGAAPDAPWLPDHGELWSAVWRHDLSTGPTETVWRGAVRCSTVPAEFTRVVTLDHGGDPGTATIRFDYRLGALADRPLPFLWSAHPLFGLTPGMQLELPGVARVRVAAVHGRHDLTPGQEADWPLDGGDRFTVPAPAGWAMKLFATVPAVARARLIDPRRGETLELLWDGEVVPLVGLWLNMGGWSPRGDPYYNLAVEPCHGAPDRLDQAVEDWGLAPFLRPGEERAWRLTVVLREGTR